MTPETSDALQRLHNQLALVETNRQKDRPLGDGRPEMVALAWDDWLLIRAALAVSRAGLPRSEPTILGIDWGKGGSVSVSKT